MEDKTNNWKESFLDKESTSTTSKLCVDTIIKNIKSNESNYCYYNERNGKKYLDILSEECWKRIQLKTIGDTTQIKIFECGTNLKNVFNFYNSTGFFGVDDEFNDIDWKIENYMIAETLSLVIYPGKYFPVFTGNRFY